MSADPRSGMTVDLGILFRKVEELVGEGPILDNMRKAFDLWDREDFEGAAKALFTAQLMIAGGVNVVRNCFDKVDPKGVTEALVHWEDMAEGSRLCTSRLAQVPAELADWRAAGRK